MWQYSSPAHCCVPHGTGWPGLGAAVPGAELLAGAYGLCEGPEREAQDSSDETRPNARKKRVPFDMASSGAGR